jgi:hypothetical protein
MAGQDFDFEYQQILVRNGKGGKDRGRLTPCGAVPSYDGRALFPASAHTISYSSHTPLNTPSSASNTG